MACEIQIITAETDEGRRAIEEIMGASYTANIDLVPAEWALIRVVDGVPVSFILVDPDRTMEFPGANVRYAWVDGVMTREDRRGEGHFRAILEETYRRLRAEGISLILLHGECALYRRLGFEVFTYHSAIFTSPDQIARTLGSSDPSEAPRFLTVEDSRDVRDDLLYVTEVRADTPEDSKAALRAAAALARARGKACILFEHPSAPSYGSMYPIYDSPETPFTELARSIGAQVRLQGADPEEGSIPDADWIKVLDTARFVKEAIRGTEGYGVPAGAVCIQTDAGVVAITNVGNAVTVSDHVEAGMERVEWPSSALAQLVTGYRSAATLSVIHGRPISEESVTFLDALFPKRWRFSRNESWVFGS